MKKFKQDLTVIHAAALQDHIMRTANYSFQPRKAQSRMANLGTHTLSSLRSLTHFKTKKTNKKTLPFEIEEELHKKQEVIDDFKQQHAYNKKLTLAQKLGLVQAPPKPMTLQEWKNVEEQSLKRNLENGVCPICLEKFRIQEHVILSCSHVFHKNCLESFEKYNKTKVCPICRRQDYEKKKYIHAHKQYAIESAILIQKTYRGYRIRIKVYENWIEIGYKPKSLLRRRLMFYKLSKVSGKLQKQLNENKENNKMNKMVENLNKNVQTKHDQIDDYLQQLTAMKQINHQYHEEIVNHKSKEEQKEVPKGKEVNWSHIKESALKRADKECSICFQSLKSKKGIYLLSCSHVFHANCLRAFERYSIKEHQNCPLCRQEYQKQHLIYK